MSTATALQTALKHVAPGATIRLAPGNYIGNFVLTSSGTAAAPITLCGATSAVLDGGTVQSGYVLYLNGASWVHVLGFSVTNGQKGVVLDHGSHDLLEGLHVDKIGDEGVHLRSDTVDTTVRGLIVSETGLATAFYGEGLYVGSANSNWCRYTACQPDASDNDQLLDNTISDTTAENIDIKEGTTGGLIEGNSLNGAGLVSSAASSWINVKGNDWRIVDNTGTSSYKDGFSDHQVLKGWGENNTFEGNTANVNGSGYGVFVQNKRLGVVVDCNNTESGARSGLSSVACTS